MREGDTGIASKSSEQTVSILGYERMGNEPDSVWKCSDMSEFIWTYAGVNEISI